MSIEVGQIVTGKITGLTKFGAFVELEKGTSGLVHISEVSDSFVKDIHDVLSVGDTVTVKVLKIADDGKISLSIRKAVTNTQPKEPRKSFHKPSFTKKSNTPTSSKGKDFDSLMSDFLKDSDERLSSLKKNTEGKRGGRGGRRN